MSESKLPSKEYETNASSLSYSTSELRFPTGTTKESTSPSLPTVPDDSKHTKHSVSVRPEKVYDADDDNDDDHDDAPNGLPSSSMVHVLTANSNNETISQLLQQKDTIQENDLLLRNNRQMLHRIAYEQIMGIRLTESSHWKMK
jgi:hypothetical protein